MDGRRRAASHGGAEQNPAYRPTRPPRPSRGGANRLLQLLEGTTELILRALGDLGLELVQHAVGEGVLAGRMRRDRLDGQVRPTDDAVLVITEQRLNRLGLLGDLVVAQGGCRVSKL